MAGGTPEEAIAVYRQIDESGPEIIAEYTKYISTTPPGAAITYTNAFGRKPTTSDMDGLVSGLAISQRIVGLSYEEAGDYPQAAAYYQKALNSKRVVRGVEYLAAKRLGFLYANGIGVPVDRQRALDLFRSIPISIPEGGINRVAKSGDVAQDSGGGHTRTCC